MHIEVIELRRKNSELELQIKTMQEEIESLLTINASFGDESDRQKKRIENLENQLKFDAEKSETESKTESETESEIGSESYDESEEGPKKSRRIQPKRKAKKPADKLATEDASVFIYFLFF